MALVRIAAADPQAVESPQQKRPAGPLPWESAPGRVAEPILRPLTSPREILQRYEIGPSQLDGFFHGQPLGPGEDDVLAKILYRFSRFGLENVARWRKTGVTWDQLAAAPSDYRAEFFAFHGRARLVEEHKLIPDLAELFEFDKYYRVTIDLADSPYRALVCTLHVPQAWKRDEPIDESVAGDGLFLKLGGTEGTDPQLVFAAGRVAWLPDRADAAQGIGPDQLALAKWGFDAGLWDAVREANGAGLGYADREAFYQLLAALAKAKPGELRRQGAAPVDVVSLLERPKEHHGAFYPVRGMARRIMKVPVGDRDVRQRFGLDHYYEIDLFLPLGDKTLRFGKDASGEKNPVYANSFPATLLVRELPASLREGDNLDHQIAADAVFFKLWSYQSGYTSQFNRLQPAPLFVAIRPRVVVVKQTSNWVAGGVVSAAFATSAIVLAAVFWWFRGGDLASEAQRRRELIGDDQSHPDFSGLE